MYETVIADYPDIVERSKVIEQVTNEITDARPLRTPPAPRRMRVLPASEQT